MGPRLRGDDNNKGRAATGEGVKSGFTDKLA